MSTVAERLKATLGSGWHVNSDSFLAQLETEIEAGGDVTAGTVAAGLPVVVDANKHIDTLGITDGGFKLGASGSETAVNATGDEINRATDLSARVVSATAATLTVTETLHEGRTIVLNRSGGITITLPAATGAGGRYRFVVGTVSTTGYVISSVVGSDLMEGLIIGASTTDSATDAARTWLSGATDDTITLNGTTKGGAAVGDWIELEDLSATGWFVRGMVSQSGTEATMFSDAVA